MMQNVAVPTIARCGEVEDGIWVGTGKSAGDILVELAPLGC